MSKSIRVRVALKKARESQEIAREIVEASIAFSRARHARAVAAAMRTLGDDRTSLNSAIIAWDREAERFEQQAVAK